jgi:acetoacetate decarboxylase
MCAKPVVETPSSMPRAAPLYPAPPFRYEGVRILNLPFNTTPETLRALVPAPLMVNPESLIFIYVGQFNVVAPVPFRYLEAGIGVPVSFSGTPGRYAVYLYLDHVGGIVAGREIYGWPKKDAKISFTEENGEISAQVVREGVTLIDATWHRSQRIDPIPEQPAVPWFNLKLIPSVKKNAPPDVMQLTSTPMDNGPKELYAGSATLTLGSSASDPVGKIQIVGMVQATYTIQDFTLGFGEVIYDYLTESEG